MANLGFPLRAVVSFHGGLQVTPPRPANQRPAILVCHGAADSFVPDAEIQQFRQVMDSAGIPFTFKSYPDATHAFTSPEATAMGEKFKLPIRYNAAADTASWNDMKAFLTQHLR
jgi:dienelactone hydrolase